MNDSLSPSSRALALALAVVLLALGCSAREPLVVDGSETGKAAQPVAASAPAGPLVDALLAAVDPDEDGAHDALMRPSRGGGVDAALRSYVREWHEDGGADLDGWTFGVGATRFAYDVREVSLFASGEAAAAAVAWAMAESGAPLERRERAGSAVRALALRGFALAFDGWAQNGCAAPTAKLLVVDPESGGVRGVDVTPCRE